MTDRLLTSGDSSAAAPSRLSEAFRLLNAATYYVPRPRELHAEIVAWLNGASKQEASPDETTSAPLCGDVVMINGIPWRCTKPKGHGEHTRKPGVGPVLEAGTPPEGITWLTRGKPDFAHWREDSKVPYSWCDCVSCSDARNAKKTPANHNPFHAMERRLEAAIQSPSPVETSALPENAAVIPGRLGHAEWCPAKSAPSCRCGVHERAFNAFGQPNPSRLAENGKGDGHGAV